MINNNRIKNWKLFNKDLNSKKFENKEIDSELNDILDKISLSGIESLSNSEGEFLDSFRSNRELDGLKNLKKLKPIIDEDLGFEFYPKTIEDSPEGKFYWGKLILPPIQFEYKDSINHINGEFWGRIIVYKNGVINPDFNHIDPEFSDYEIFDFTVGLEYELDDFLERCIDF
jgi:hypothetical protein